MNVESVHASARFPSACLVNVMPSWCIHRPISFNSEKSKKDRVREKESLRHAQTNAFIEPIVICDLQYMRFV